MTQRLHANTPLRDATAARAAIEALAHSARIVDVPSSEGHIRWRVWGKGEPVVLLHGGHGSWLHWMRNIDALASFRSVWIPDMPGYGDSANWRSEPRTSSVHDRFLDALVSSMDHVLGRHTLVDLAGFSFGGLVAGQLTALRGNVGRLVLLGPSGHGGPRRQTLELRNWRGLNTEETEACMRHNLSALMLHDTHAVDALAVEIHARSSAQTRYHSRTISRTPALIEALEGVCIPTLMIWGEHDVTADPAIAAHQLVRQHAERKWGVAKGAGHWVQYESPGTINHWLREWLTPVGQQAV